MSETQKKVVFDLSIFNSINHGPLRQGKYDANIELELTSGKHLFKSVPVVIGSFFHFKVYAHISIPYSYDLSTGFITICGPDATGDEQLAIHTCLEQHNKMTNQYNSKRSDTTEASPNMWTDFIESNPKVKQMYQTTIRQVIDTLVNKLLDSGVQGVIQTGSAPIVNPYNFQDYKAMFTPEKADVEQPSLDDLLEVQSMVESTYYGTITWSLNYAFANIIGSTSDPKPQGYSSWIRLWADACNNGYGTTHCSSFNYANGHTPFTCNTTDFVGGHVIPGQSAKSVAKGGTAYIFPICKSHNNNDNIYMSSRYNPVGVVLHNYNQ